MKQDIRRAMSQVALVGVLSAAALSMGSGTASAAGASCGLEGENCSFSLDVDGKPLGTGRYNIGSDGTISLPSAVTFTLESDPNTFITVDTLSGNADPVLGLHASAGTGAIGHTFAFNFDLPINLNSSVTASSTIGYSLTALTGAGAQIAASVPGHSVLFAQDVDTSVGGLPSLDKHVDAGGTFKVDPFTPTPGAPTRTEQSQTFSAVSTLNVTPAYDTMNAIIAFSLSPQSTVGISGSVSQVVPEPSSIALMLTGLGVIGWVARRRLHA